jgi:hypothetical protein
MRNDDPKKREAKRYREVNKLRGENSEQMKKIHVLTERVEELETEAELNIKAQQAQPTICAHVDGGWVWSNCPACGTDIGVDEEGCCTACGRDALWHGKQEMTHV